MIRSLIIGGGDSSKQLIGFKDKLLGTFDIVIGVGGSFMEFDNQMTHHLVTEKYFTEQDILNKGNYSESLPRLVNFKSLQRYNKKYNLCSVTRAPHTGDFDQSAYIKTATNEMGLVTGIISSSGISLGTVVLQAMHLSTINNADEIYLAGVDLRFNSDKDHFYGGRYYRDHVSKHTNAARIVRVGNHATTNMFRDSAVEIDRFIEDIFTNVKFFDFSDGLLTRTIKKDIGGFFTEHGIIGKYDHGI